MRIGIIAISYLSGSGFSELINQVKILGQKDQQNEYYIFLSNAQKTLKKFMPSRFKTIYLSILPSNSILRAIVAQFVLPFYERRFKIDLFFCYGNTALFFTRAKNIMFLQNASPFSLMSDASLYNKIRNKILKYITILSAKKANLVLYPSNNSMEIFNEYISIDEKKANVVYHGWHPQEIIVPPGIKNYGKENILTVTAILPFKKLEVLMEAFDITVRTFNYTGNLLIIGDLSDKKYFKKLNDLKRTLKSGSKINFLGKIEYKHIFWFYAQAEVFVFTSIEETFGIPLVEAMGMGLPVVAADIKLADSVGLWFNPAREICGDAALYYNPFSASDLADKLLMLLGDKILCHKLGAAAVKRAQNFDGKKVVGEIIETFNTFSL